MITRFENANWIFCDGVNADVCNGYFDYQTTFQAKENQQTTLYISATSLYAVAINGKFVDCGQYPGYEDYQVYDTLDITSFLKDGENTLSITQYVAGVDLAICRVLTPGVIFTIWQEEACIKNSDVDCLSRINPYYMAGEMEYATWQIGFTFKFDARNEAGPFQKSILADKEKSLYERPIKKLPIEEKALGVLKNQGVFLEGEKDKPIGKRMQDAYLAARTKEELLVDHSHSFSWDASTENLADGVYFIFDTLAENVGFLSFDLEVPTDCEILIGYGEHLEDLRVRSYVEDRNFCGSYYAKAGRNTFFHPFLRVGMRYLQLHIYSKQGTLHSAGIRSTYYPLEVSECKLTDALHKKIYEVGVQTLRHCMHEHYEDCPWREQALYAFDSRIQMLCGYYAFREYDFPKASLRLMARSLRTDGTLELWSPGKAPITIPSFTATFVRQVYEYITYSNDWAFAEEIFPCLQEIIKQFEARLNENNLLPCFAGKQYWNFYEWRDGLSGGERFTEDNAPYELPLNAFVSDAFFCFARICDVVMPEASSRYDALHQNMNQAMHRIFYLPERQVYITRLGDCGSAPFHTLTQALALYCGAVPESCKTSVIENMISGEIIPCSLSSSIYKYDALLRGGEAYADFVKNEIEQRWGRILYSGATTFWETDDGASDFSDAGSLCHGWSAVPIYLYGKYPFLIK